MQIYIYCPCMYYLKYTTHMRSRCHRYLLRRAICNLRFADDVEILSIQKEAKPKSKTNKQNRIIDKSPLVSIHFSNNSNFIIMVSGRCRLLVLVMVLSRYL